jgi:replication factor C large subunit
MAAVYELDAKEVSFITGSGADTNKVQGIVEEAEELREVEAVEHSGGAFEGFVSDGDDTSEPAPAEGETEPMAESQAAASEPDMDDSADSDDDQSGLDDFF